VPRQKPVSRNSRQSAKQAKRSSKKALPGAPKFQDALKSNLVQARTDEELFADFRLAADSCPACKGKRIGRSGGRCQACRSEQEAIFSYWLDRVPPDGKRSWRTRIQGFVNKNHKGYQQVVGVTVAPEDVEQDVLLAVWMVWDRYYDPNYISKKTGNPVKLCTYVWRSIQTAWAKVTERCFCVRNTVHMIRKEDAGKIEHQPIYDPDSMCAAIAKLAGLDRDDLGVAALARKCRTSHDKRPFTPAMLEEMSVEAESISADSCLDRLMAAVLQVSKRKRNAVPAHMMMKSLDAPAASDSEDDASNNSELVADIDYRLEAPDQAASDLAGQVKTIVSSCLSPIEQRIFFGCIAGSESIRSIANQYHMTVADVKSKMSLVRHRLDDAKQDGIFDSLIE